MILLTDDGALPSSPQDLPLLPVQFMFTSPITGSQLCPPFLLSWKCHRRTGSADAHPTPRPLAFPLPAHPVLPAALSGDSTCQATWASCTGCCHLLHLVTLLFPCHPLCSSHAGLFLFLKHPVFIWVSFPSTLGASPAPLVS